MRSLSCEQIEEVIRSILGRELELDLRALGASSATTPLLGRGIGLDSIDALTLITALEKQFDIEVDDAELTVGLFKTVRTLAEFILYKTSQRSAGTTANNRQ